MISKTAAAILKQMTALRQHKSHLKPFLRSSQLDWKALFGGCFLSIIEQEDLSQFPGEEDGVEAVMEVGAPDSHLMWGNGQHPAGASASV